jgi:quercetin dioxygenase-like cupin family protein
METARRDASDDGGRSAPGFQIFRASAARDMTKEVGDYENMSPADERGMQVAGEAGMQHGSLARVIFSEPASGVSLGYVWFKENYVLPRHSHNADCLYYIISGEAHLGTEISGVGDGFFVPANGNYQYTAGPDGVEILEFRTADNFNFRFSGNSEAVWRRIAATAAENAEAWKAGPPSTMAQRLGGA